MPNVLKHKFVSAKTQNPDATIVSKNEWNDEHVFAGGTNGYNLVFDSTLSDKVKWQSAGTFVGPTLPFVNVKLPPYNAVGDGVTDDTTALQDAINDMQNVGGGLVFIPPPTLGQSYRVTTPLLITKPVSLRGAHLGTSIRGVGLTSSQYVINIDGTVNPNLEDVKLESLVLLSDNNTPGLIKINNLSNSVFRDLILRNCVNGITVTGNRCFSNVYDRVTGLTGISGSNFNYTAYTGGGHQTFIGCLFNAPNGVSVPSDSNIDGFVLLSCNFEGCATNAFSALGNVRGLSFFGCRFEKNLGTIDILVDPALGKTAFGITIAGCYFETDIASSYAVSFGGTSGKVRGFSVTGCYAQDYTGAFVRLNGEGQSGIICGNYLQDGNNIVNAVRPGVLVLNNENQAGPLGPVWNPPLATEDYTVTNNIVNRSLDESTATLAQVAQVLGNLIIDLTAVGVIK